MIIDTTNKREYKPSCDDIDYFILQGMKCMSLSHVPVAILD